jgi:hypothetical protein
MKVDSKEIVVWVLLTVIAVFSAVAISFEFHLGLTGNLGIFAGIYGIMMAIQLK